MLLQTNSYIVPKEKRVHHARLMRRFRQTMHRLGCDQFEAYEQVAANWNSAGESGRFVQIMRFRDRRHQQAVQIAEREDVGAQQLIAEFCNLINLPYQHQQGYFATGFYTSVPGVAPAPIEEYFEDEFAEDAGGQADAEPQAAAESAVVEDELAGGSIGTDESQKHDPAFGQTHSRHEDEPAGHGQATSEAWPPEGAESFADKPITTQSPELAAGAEAIAHEVDEQAEEALAAEAESPVAVESPTAEAAHEIATEHSEYESPATEAEADALEDALTQHEAIATEADAAAPTDAPAQPALADDDLAPLDFEELEPRFTPAVAGEPLNALGDDAFAAAIEEDLAGAPTEVPEETTSAPEAVAENAAGNPQAVAENAEENPESLDWMDEELAEHPASEGGEGVADPLASTAGSDAATTPLADSLASTTEDTTLDSTLDAAIADESHATPEGEGEVADVEEMELEPVDSGQPVAEGIPSEGDASAELELEIPEITAEFAELTIAVPNSQDDVVTVGDVLAARHAHTSDNEQASPEPLDLAPEAAETTPHDPLSAPSQNGHHATHAQPEGEVVIPTIETERDPDIEAFEAFLRELNSPATPEPGNHGR
ncbi:MAG TPA: hypothetical protein VG269_01680 [Tepidisphaeraceae bacterium]|jgi:hypothetical protein|nr:hypothetical protein [Tepidisphaeraceae bacterium]